jgi:hypothetical protein
MKNLLLVLVLLTTLTSCGVYQVVGSVNYTKEYKTDSTITRVYYDSTTIRLYSTY